MIRLNTILTLLLVTVNGPIDPPEPPTPADLAAITARGRDLAGYDQAALYATDAVMEKKPKPGSVAGYIARKTEKGWVVDFGKLDKDKSKYLVTYEATQDKEPDQFTVEAFDPPKVVTEFLPPAARAIGIALKDFTDKFQSERRPYNVAILPAEKGMFFVYLFPAQTKPDVWPLGGDVRYAISADGNKIEGKRQLHKAIIENERPKDQAQQPAAGVHTHILAEIPEDTDVAHVLARKPAVPELIRAEHFVFVIEPDGEARYLGKVEDVFKQK